MFAVEEAEIGRRGEELVVELINNDKSFSASFSACVREKLGINISGNITAGKNRGFRDVQVRAGLRTSWALVIRVNDKIRDLGDLLAVARAEAQKRHGLKHVKIEVVEIIYVPSQGVYVALYKTPGVRRGRCKPKA